MRWLAVALAAAGCMTGATPTEAPPAADGAAPPPDLAYACTVFAVDGGDLPCEVAAVLAARCQICHRSPTKNHAPWPLERYEDAVSPYGIEGLVRWQRMAQVIEPPTLPHMPPNGYPQLTDGEREVLRKWFHACAAPVPDHAGCDLEDGGFGGFDLGADTDASAAVDGGAAD